MISAAKLPSLLTTATVGAVVFLGACSSDDDSAEPSGEGSTSTTVATETTETEAPATTAAADAPEPTAGADAAGAAIEATLGEFFIEAPTSYEAGTVTFSIVNDGDFSHELGVVKGESYESLPLTEAGGIDTDAAAGDIVGTSEVIRNGETTELTVDLEAGDYVLYCNLNPNGPVSHAEAGQVLSVSVS